MECDATLGDLVTYNAERGVLVCLDPPIMRCLEAHCYVPITDAYEVIQTAFDLDASIRDEVVERIKRYLESTGSPDDPTGH